MISREPQIMVHSVSLVGVDGSGKSTQAQHLFYALRKQNAQVVVIHPFGWKLLAFASRFASLGLLPSRERLNHHQHPGLQSRIISWLEIMDIAVYVWANYLRCLMIAVFMNQQVWLVSDRSFDDLLVKHQHRKTLSASAARVIRRLMPRIEKTFWLKTDPQVAMRRDGEFPESYYCEMQHSYQMTAQDFGWQVIPTSDRTPEAVFADIQASLQGEQDG